jgi:hypothetical protein
MVLLAIFAALLPAQRASAQEPKIVLTDQEVRKQLYEAWTMDQVKKTGYRISWAEARTKSLLIADQMLVDVSLDPDVVFKQAEALQERFIKRLGPRGADPEYRFKLSPRVSEEAMYAAALESPYFKESAKRVYEETKARAPKLLGETVTSDGRAYYQSYIEGNLLDTVYRTLLQEKIDQAVARAESDEKFVKSWDAAFAPFTGVKLEGFDAKGFLAAHPEAAPVEIQNAIKPDGTMEISLAELEQLAKGEFANINASIDDMQKTLVEISKTQGELVDYMNDQKKRQAAQELAEAKEKEHQLRLQAASSAVSIVSTLVGLKYPERGKQIAVVGGSLIKISDSLRGWMQATAGLNGLSKIGSLSTVVMTGNVLGAVMNIVSLFGPQQPPPEQIILEEIGKLRQQVNELRTEMHTRFDQVDKQLNAIYTAMNERFNLIDIQLGKINGNLQEIQQSLLSLGIQLNRMERNNVEYLDAIGRRPLREAMNGALGYKERTGVDMPYQPDFVAYENTFHTWGTVNAFDALSAGPTQRDYSDGQVLAELSAAPLDANLNYLNGWLQTHGMQPFATGRLPSPRDWAFASRAYAELGLDWPAHIRRISGPRQAALDAVGNDLQQALGNISTIQTPSGPQGNGPLFTALTDYYNAKLQALDSALKGSEAAFVNEVQRSLNRSAPFDLYGGLDQSLAYPYQPDDFSTTTCGGTAPPESQLATPRHLKNMIADYNRFALADYLQVSPLKVCVNAAWVNLDPPCVAGPGTCDRYGQVRVVLQVLSDNKAGLVSHYLDKFRQKYSDENVWNVIAPEWATFWKPKFEMYFIHQITPPPLTPAAAQQLEAVSSATATKLAALQRAHAGRVPSELSSGPLRTRAVELAGAKKLLESFITLGLPRAIDNDDLLRSLLFSGESLVDDQQIALAYTRPTTQTLSATAAGEAQPLVNPRVTLLQTAQKRHDALAGLLNDYLGNISTENYREDIALVAGARFDMQLARAFADSNTPLPEQKWVVFLPLVAGQ